MRHHTVSFDEQARAEHEANRLYLASLPRERREWASPERIAAYVRAVEVEEDPLTHMQRYTPPAGVSMQALDNPAAWYRKRENAQYKPGIVADREISVPKRSVNLATFVDLGRKDVRLSEQKQHGGTTARPYGHWYVRTGLNR